MSRPRAFVLLLVGALLLAPMVLMRPAEAAGTGSISGVITDRDGQPVAGVDVQVDGPGVRMHSFTDADGLYLADGLAAGTYSVCFYPEGWDLARECWEDIEPVIPHHTPVEVGDGQHVIGIDAVLLPYSSLRGTVTDERGRPIEGALVSKTWYTPDGGRAWELDPHVTAADGSFDLGPMWSGEYTVKFSDTWSNRYASEWWEDAPTEEASTHIVLDRGESRDLHVVLADLAHVTGRVTGADGSDASGTKVRLFKVNPSGTYSEVGNGRALAADGRYDIALQPGTYRLKFDAAPGRYRSEYWKDARSVETAKDVVINGTTSVTDLDAVLADAPPVQLLRPPTISGRPRVGEWLKVSDGAWDVRWLRYTYRWRADGAAIPQANERRLRLTPKLRGKQISVQVKVFAVTAERSPGQALTRRTQAVASSFN